MILDDMKEERKKMFKHIIYLLWLLEQSRLHQ
jgi:hypothetical protein